MSTSENQVNFSIITPVKNGRSFVKPYVEMLSRLHLLPGDEIIIIDDNSTDSTADLLKKAINEAENLPARVIKSDGNGVVDARHRGAEAAANRYLLFADIDDELVADGVDALRQSAQSTDADIVVADYEMAFENGRRQHCGYFNTADGFDSLFDFIITRHVGNLWGKLIKRDLYLNIPLLDRSLTFCQDYSQMLQLAAMSQSTAHCGATSYIYCQHPNSNCNRAYDVDVYGRRFGRLASNFHSLSNLHCFTPEQATALQALTLVYARYYIGVAGRRHTEFVRLLSAVKSLLSTDRNLVGLAGYTPGRRRQLHLLWNFPTIFGPFHRLKLRRQGRIRKSSKPQKD
ncbi:MAG: glycosyltransferase family 2 protein [Muribaculaceae bacterium]|nr:glycosyltransferase family 2 protein [Muribaculaceae bacterium]MDE5968964.1 glycosyltransferase family 2 protein [Muribaculaceae bacterium]